MGDKTSISWTAHTWNPWHGCNKVSPGCKHCYCLTALARMGMPLQVLPSKSTWGDPFRWQRKAAAARPPRFERVFTCSWSDFFHIEADPYRERAWSIIRKCPNLDFQVLTKRPENIPLRLPLDWGDGWPNVWLGVSVENPDYLWRVDLLRKIPARARFISAEPLLAPLPTLDLTGIHWVIVGGESGPGYRPMDLEWARELREICKAAGVAFFFKQSAAPRTEMGTTLDGVTYHEFPTSDKGAQT